MREEFIVVPNHIHSVITIVGAPLVGALNNYNGVNVSNNDITDDLKGLLLTENV